MTTSPPPASVEDKPPSRARSLALTALSVAIALGGGGLLLRVAQRQRAHSAARLLALDLARLEGCLYAGAVPATAQERAARLAALALGDGDTYWPHSCAPHLGRLVNEAGAARFDDSSAGALEALARGVEGNLGEGVFWVEHRRRGQPEEPRWAERFGELHSAVERFARSQGESLRAIELPRHPRIPRAPEAPPAAPEPTPLPRGTEAELLDLRVDPQGAAWLQRDHRGRYSLCRVAPREEGPVRCAWLQVRGRVDPRVAHFVPGLGPARVAFWLPSPSDARLVLDASDGVERARLEGLHSPERESWSVGPAVFHVATTQLRQTPLAGEGQPASVTILDVTPADRVLVGHGNEVTVALLDTRSRGQSALRVERFALGLRSAERRDLLRFPSPTPTDLDRSLDGCSTTGEAGWLLFGRHGERTVWSRGARGWARGGTFPWSSRTLRASCDGERLLARGEGQAWSCSRERCESLGEPLEAAEGAVVAQGRVLRVGPDAQGALRVRFAGSAETGRFEPSPPHAARAVLAAEGEVVLLLALGSETQAWWSVDAGRTFRTRTVVDEAEPAGSR